MLSNKEIKDLMRSFDSSSLSKLKIADTNFELVMQKGGEIVSAPVVTPAQPVATPAPSIPAAASTPASEQPSTPKGDTINSVMVGTFYSSPSPDSAPFVKKGDRVKKGQALCILEAMKIMNEIEAEFDCKIVDILVEDGQPVEYDMPLFLIEKL